MIKAEVITHEGNPGPNWLDRCRTLATPGKVTILIVVVAVAALILLIGSDRHVGQANQVPATSTQQATPAPGTALQVTPVTDTSTTTENKAASLQSPGSVTASNTGLAPTDSASKLGPTTTPSLNTSQNASQAIRSAPLTSQLPNGAAITQTVQSNLQSAQNNAANAAAEAKSKLGL